MAKIYKVQDAAGDVEFTSKDLAATDLNDFIRKACDKLELNVSYETLEAHDFFKRELPQASSEEAAAAGPVGSHPSPEPPTETELPQGEATISEPTKPDLKPLSKEGDASLTTGAEPLEDLSGGEEATIDGGEQEPEVKQPSVEDFTDDAVEEPSAEKTPKYKQRKPKEETMSKGRSNTPNPGHKSNESKLEEGKLDKEWFKMSKEDRKKALKSTGSWDSDHDKAISKMGGSQQDVMTDYMKAKMKKESVEAYFKTVEGKKVLAEAKKKSLKEFTVVMSGDKITSVKMDDDVTVMGDQTKVGDQETPKESEGKEQEPAGQKTPEVPGNKDSEVGKEPTEVKEFTAHLNGKGEVKEITIQEDFTIHGHHTKVEPDNNHMAESLMVKYGLTEGGAKYKCTKCGSIMKQYELMKGKCEDCGGPVEELGVKKEALTPRGDNNDGALVGPTFESLSVKYGLNEAKKWKCADCDHTFNKPELHPNSMGSGKNCPECGSDDIYLNKKGVDEACSGMKSKKKMEDANDNPMLESPMYTDTRTFESAVNELVREVSEALEGLNEAEEGFNLRKKVIAAIKEASKWGYERADQGLIKEKAMRKIMRKMKKTHMQEAESTLSKDDEDQEFAGQSSEEYLEKGSQNHELLPDETNKVDESKKSYDPKTWKDSRSHKSLVRSLTKDVMEALEGLDEANSGSIMSTIDECAEFMLEGRPDASYIKKMALKKINRKMKRKAAQPVDEATISGNQKQLLQVLQGTLAKLGKKVVGTTAMGKDLIVDLTAGGGEILITPEGYCELDNMGFDPGSAEQIKDILDSGDDIRSMQKPKMEESVDITAWELNGKEGNIDLYSGEDFVDSFNLQDLSKHFCEINHEGSEFAKADIQNGWVVFYSADGTELGKDPMDELVDFFLQQRGEERTPEGNKPPETVTGEPAHDVADVEESVYNKYIK